MTVLSSLAWKIGWIILSGCFSSTSTNARNGSLFYFSSPEPFIVRRSTWKSGLTLLFWSFDWNWKFIYNWVFHFHEHRFSFFFAFAIFSFKNKNWSHIFICFDWKTTCCYSKLLGSVRMLQNLHPPSIKKKFSCWRWKIDNFCESEVNNWKRYFNLNPKYLLQTLLLYNGLVKTHLNS